MTDKEQKSRSVKSVPVWLLITVALAFAVGLVSGLVIMNLTTASGRTLSTTSIIAFTFTVALGAAAIILASLTIVLSRSAQDALIKRSDEGIRLQNDVFVKTSEVLSTIQASTGVTEKRLEDIISGRTGVIAQEVFERSFPKGETSLSLEAEDRLKKSLADSLKEELIPLFGYHPSETERRLIKMEARQKRLSGVSKRWDEFRQSVVTELGRLDQTKVVSETRGRTDAATMEEFWDAVLDIEGRRVAFSIQTTGQIGEDGPYLAWLTSAKARSEFAQSITWRAWEDKINTLFWVWNEDVSEEAGIIELLKLMQAALRNTDLVLLHGDAPAIAQAVLSHVSSAKLPKEEGDVQAQPEDLSDKE
ncbi:MAG: hypothetical protein WBF13_00730 [Candidatus Zixiibacteriota bacterium]